MKRFISMAAFGVLAICLAGWAALAWAEHDPTPPPAKKEPATPVIIPVSPAAADIEPVSPPGIAPAAPAEKNPVVPGPQLGTTPLPPAPAPSPLPGAVGAPALLRNPTFLAPEIVPGAPIMPTRPKATVILPLPNSPPGPNSLPSVGSEEFNPEEPTSAPAENGAGKCEPAVSIEWIGPPTVKVGVPADFNLLVRNTTNIPVQQVLVRVRMPQGVSVAAAEPKCTRENNILIWELGTMMPKHEKNLVIRMVAEARGDVALQAWVTFTGSALAHIKVREPKLAVKAVVMDKVLIGDAATITLMVSNPGDGVAEQVKIHATLSNGLEHARGNKIDFEIGNLTSGETRSVQLICGTKTGGAQKCEATAEADGGLASKDVAAVNVIMPRLDLAVSGPALRYLDRKALYTIKVTNPGDAPASNVTVGDVVPAGFKVLAASDGGRHDFATRTVSWFLGEIGPGQAREVKLEVQAVNTGEYKHHANARGARGLRADAEAGTRVEGLSALLVELVDTEDPIEVNGETAYEVRITNTGSKTETDIKLVATVPEKMELKNCQGPTKWRSEATRTIVFEPVDKLAPRADVVYRFNVKCLEPGTVRFKIQVTSTNLTEPVIKMEATRIYSDTPEVKQP